MPIDNVSWRFVMNLIDNNVLAFDIIRDVVIETFTRHIVWDRVVAETLTLHIIRNRKATEILTLHIVRDDLLT